MTLRTQNMYIHFINKNKRLPQQSEIISVNSPLQYISQVLQEKKVILIMRVLFFCIFSSILVCLNVFFLLVCSKEQSETTFIIEPTIKNDRLPWDVLSKEGGQEEAV